METIMKPKVLALIPTRLNSARLPAKALLPINNLPLVMHVYKRVLLSKNVDEAIICCDDKKILNAVKKYSAKAVITSKHHTNGTDRICEVFNKIKNKVKYFKKHLSVVSFQPKSLISFGKSKISELEKI